MGELKDQYAQIFDFYDRTRTGTLTHEEVKALMVEADIQLNPEDLKMFFSEVEDPVNIDTFMSMFSTCCNAAYNDLQIINAFKVFDKAGTGFANVGELK
jgi:Ca2+-binding EF-hand superfamily protein